MVNPPLLRGELKNENSFKILKSLASQIRFLKGADVPTWFPFPGSVSIPELLNLGDLNDRQRPSFDLRPFVQSSYYGLASGNWWPRCNRTKFTSSQTNYHLWNMAIKRSWAYADEVICCGGERCTTGELQCHEHFLIWAKSTRKIDLINL